MGCFAAAFGPSTAVSRFIDVLWLALYFPSLGVDLLDRLLPEPVPVALVDSEGARQRVLQVNSLAHGAGIRSGMGAAAALALLPTLRFFRRDQAGEMANLRRWAALAYAYSPQVVLLPECFPALALELGGSAHLFAGVAGVARHLRRLFQDLGVAVRVGIAPTPLGAALLAQWQDHGCCITLAQWQHDCLELPIALLPLPEAARRDLAALGLSQVKALWVIPRKQLSRRFGPAIGQLLDRIAGVAPDPRPPLAFAPKVAMTVQLPAEAESWSGLRFALRRVLQDLCEQLRVRAQAAQAWRLQLILREGQVTFSLSMRRPSRDAEALLVLWQSHLEGKPSTAPIRALRLAAVDLTACGGQQQGLWEDAQEEALWSFVERLRARLGAAAVTSIAPVAEHRPERAWRRVAPGEAPAAGGGNARRPLWLLPAPLPLPASLSVPPSDQLERIEGGWWDGRDVARDYFALGRPDGSRCWVYRDLRSGGYFLHGYFA